MEWEYFEIPLYKRKGDGCYTQVSEYWWYFKIYIHYVSMLLFRISFWTGSDRWLMYKLICTVLYWQDLQIIIQIQSHFDKVILQGFK